MANIDQNIAGYKNNKDFEEENGLFSLQNIIDILILHWPWFILCTVICLGSAFFYLKTVTPKYVAYAKILIKDDENASSRARSKFASIVSAENLGTISNSAGIDNELEILNSRSVIEAAVREKKLYVDYQMKGKLRNQPIYKYQPLSVDIDSLSLTELKFPIMMSISKVGKGYNVKAKYTVVYKDERDNKECQISRKIESLPAVIKTEVGTLTFTKNPEQQIAFKDDREMLVRIISVDQAAISYFNALSVEQTGKQTSIAQLTLTDQVPDRAIDFLQQLSESYNNEANLDKNIVAIRTEEFINSRLEKLNYELGLTDKQLEDYKRQNNVIKLEMNAATALNQSTEYDKKMAEMSTQIALMNSMDEFMGQNTSNYQPLPNNIGINDPTSASLIQKYNDLAIRRAHLLKSASESSQVVIEITDEMGSLSKSIRQSLRQAQRSLEYQQRELSMQHSKYSNEVSSTPQQERILTQIGREQEVRAGLYLMLLQKREENSISLSATADKGKLIDKPAYGGQVSPKRSMVYAIALAIGLGLPLLIFILIQLLRYKIEGHEDVTKLSHMPIIADIAVASENAKTKADIVVHENSNTQMEEIFRALRTNIQFMLKEGENVIMLTSSMSGEGKTFIAANLSVSLALLGKKVILIGLDIRKPRLAELFHINNHHNGITTLLTSNNPTLEDIKGQILPSGVNDRLDLLMAGIIPPNPAELIARQSLVDIIDILKKEYDYVIIDTAPVGLVTDTLQIGRVSNATIFVCRADYTPKSCFGYANELFDDKKLPNMSIVINGIDMSKSKHSYKYGYGRYGRYGVYGRKSYGSYGNYGNYGSSVYGKSEDNSIKK